MECIIDFERPVNETLWYAIMTCSSNGGAVYGDNPDHTYENDTFVVKSYDWSDEENTNDWHFWHKPSGFKLQWYKYPMRSPLVNMEITHEQFYTVLHDCMNSVHPRFTVQIEEWW